MLKIFFQNFKSRISVTFSESNAKTVRSHPPLRYLECLFASIPFRPAVTKAWCSFLLIGNYCLLLLGGNAVEEKLYHAEQLRRVTRG